MGSAGDKHCCWSYYNTLSLKLAGPCNSEVFMERSPCCPILKGDCRCQGSIRYFCLFFDLSRESCAFTNRVEMLKVIFGWDIRHVRWNGELRVRMIPEQGVERRVTQRIVNTVVVGSHAERQENIPVFFAPSSQMFTCAVYSWLHWIIISSTSPPCCQRHGLSSWSHFSPVFHGVIRIYYRTRQSHLQTESLVSMQGTQTYSGVAGLKALLLS